MKRNTLNFIIDLVSALVLFGIIAIGLLLRFVMPPGSGGRILWGMTRHDWGDLHFWLAVATAGVLLVHVAMHWSWVCTTVVRLSCTAAAEPARMQSWIRNLAGVAFLFLLVAVFYGLVWIARDQVQMGNGGERHEFRGPPPYGR